MARRLDLLPKAHLHLHFIGAMRRSTLIELAEQHGITLPDAFRGDWPPKLRGTDERGWFRFQRLYDYARAVLRTEADVRRLITEIAQDERAEGSGWLEYQVDPSGYAGRFGGLTAFTELVLDATADAAARDRRRDRRDPRGEPDQASARRQDGGQARRQLRGTRRDRLRPVQRRAARAAPPTSPRRSGSRPGPGCSRSRMAANCSARRASAACLRGPARGSDRPRCRRGDRSRAGQAAGRPADHARGLPGVERGARRRGHAAADVPLIRAARRGRTGRARRRRPAALRVPADRPVRAGQERPPARPMRLWPGSRRMSVRGSAAPDEVKTRLLARIDAWLAAPDPSEDAEGAGRQDGARRAGQPGPVVRASGDR